MLLTSKPLQTAARTVPSQESVEPGEAEGIREEEPLLGKKEEQQQFKLSKDQPALARKITILPCRTNPKLMTAFLVAIIQALLLGSFDATVPTTAQELFGLGAVVGYGYLVPVLTLLRLPRRGGGGMGQVWL